MSHGDNGSRRFPDDPRRAAVNAAIDRELERMRETEPSPTPAPTEENWAAYQEILKQHDEFMTVWRRHLREQ